MGSVFGLRSNNYKQVPFWAWVITIYLGILGGLVLGFTIFSAVLFLLMPSSRMNALIFVFIIGLGMGLPLAYVAEYFWKTRYPDLKQILRSVFLVVMVMTAILILMKLLADI